jgi:hypothetical protein
MSSNGAAAASSAEQQQQQQQQEKKPSHLLGWEMSDKIKPEVNPGAVGLWTFFSPLAGIVPKDALNLGQGEARRGEPIETRAAILAELTSVGGTIA